VGSERRRDTGMEPEGRHPHFVRLARSSGPLDRFLSHPVATFKQNRRL
jgi:hypothetical protein